VERREARVPVTTARGRLREVPSCYQRHFGAPLPHADEGRKWRRRPRADHWRGRWITPIRNRGYARAVWHV